VSVGVAYHRLNRLDLSLRKYRERVLFSAGDFAGRDGGEAVPVHFTGVCVWGRGECDYSGLLLEKQTSPAVSLC
jgi:hypothetical protein